MRLDVDGIQDLFTIRNKIIAHPAGRAQLQVAGGQPGRLDKHVSYQKFKEFPLVYSGFTIEHADKVFAEVTNFLTSFLSLLSGKITKEQLAEWSPAELDQWHKSGPMH